VPDALTYFEAMLELNQRSGVATILVLPPFSSALYKAIEETPRQRDYFARFVTRACPQLSQMIAAARWIAARKFLAVLS
ncbi:MAG: hypothetical protein ACRECZ_09315, partial [Methylocella sp.]